MLGQQKRIKLTVSMLLACIVLGQPSTAQIIPDNSLPNNSFVISPDGTTHLINGGTQAGTNLFHSFQEFSINQGETAFFNNSLEIQNIFSRITGTSFSTINGLIAANGLPNLFLFNPNGITFGPNAAIAVGSFFASSADKVIFADGFEFRADGQKTPLLSFNRPIGLGFNNPGPIEVQGNGNPFQYVAFAAPILPAGQSHLIFVKLY